MQSFNVYTVRMRLKEPYRYKGKDYIKKFDKILKEHVMKNN